MAWNQDMANAWRSRTPWLCGFNYLPRTAANSTDMWRAETFAPEVIREELEWAQSIGLNTCRVFLPHIVWREDPVSFMRRLDVFLALAWKHGLVTMPVLFDDCAFAGKQPYLGPQDPPVPGVHNSCWTPSPGHDLVVNRDEWPSLGDYVQSVIRELAMDERVIVWDLYNEPGNSDMGDRSLPLLEATFGWARAANPSQPLTVGVWNRELDKITALSLMESDVISFHDYNSLSDMRAVSACLLQRKPGYPLLCTEWMARTRDSRFSTHLPYMRAEGIHNWFWGFAAGRTQTFMPWGSKPGDPEPVEWFHDLVQGDGGYYNPAEISCIRECMAGFLNLNG